MTPPKKTRACGKGEGDPGEPHPKEIAFSIPPPPLSHFMDTDTLREMWRRIGPVIPQSQWTRKFDVDMTDATAYEGPFRGGASTASRAGVDPTVGRISATGSDS
jgi:hypothetical protein